MQAGPEMWMDPRHLPGRIATNHNGLHEAEETLVCRTMVISGSSFASATRRWNHRCLWSRDHDTVSLGSSYVRHPSHSPTTFVIISIQLYQSQSLLSTSLLDICIALFSIDLATRMTAGLLQVRVQTPPKQEALLSE